MLSTKKKLVSVKGTTTKKERKITIPSSIKLSGRLYHVTKIEAKAFYKNASLKTVTLNSKYLTSIGKKSFAGNKKLCTIKIWSKKLKSVGKQAFASTATQLKLFVPSSCMKKYKKLTRGKGTGKNIMICKLKK